MDRHTRKRISRGRIACVFAAASLVLISIVFAVLWYYLKFLPLVLTALLLVLPALLNLLLFMPDGKKYIKIPKAPKPPRKKTTFKEKIKAFPKKVFGFVKKIIAFLRVNRNNIAIILISAVLIGANLLFWSMVTKTGAHKFGFWMPLIFGAAFLLLIVIDKWSGYVKSDLGDSREAVMLENIHSVTALGKIVSLACAAASTFCTLGFFDLQKPLVIFIGIMFAYETAFLVLSFAVRLIKKELHSNPDMLIPLPGRANEDLGIIAYLEKNTGITMRSLWSILLIKKIIPFAVIGSAFVLWLCGGIVQIESYQQGAHYRLGKLKSEYLQPGIHFVLPWPFDSVEIYDTESVNEITVGYLATDATDNLWTEAHGNNEYKLLLGGGNELVSINLRIEYKIKELGKYLSSSSSPVSLLESSAYETVTNKTINTDLDTILATDREVFSDSFEKELRDRISKFETGIEIVDVVIESIHPPVEVAQIYQRIISVGIEAEKIILEAQGVAGVKIAEAQAEHDKNINIATAENHTKTAEAESAIAEFLASVQNEKDYGDGYRYYKYLEAIQKAYSGAKLVIVGEGIDSSNLYLGSIS